MQKKVQQKYRDIACKAKFFPPYLRKAAKLMLQHPMVWLDRKQSIYPSEELALCEFLHKRSTEVWKTDTNSACRLLYQLIPKTIGNRKRDCAWGCARGINTTWSRKSADRKAQISPVSGKNAFLICAFRSADLLRWLIWFDLLNLQKGRNLIQSCTE